MVLSALEAEHARLSLNERHIAEAQRRVMDQSKTVERLRAIGQDTALAEKMLYLMHRTMREFRLHRGLILDRIAYLQGDRRASA